MLAALLHHFVMRFPIHATPTIIGEPIAGVAVPTRSRFQKTKLGQALESDVPEARGQLAGYLERAMVQLQMVEQLSLPRTKNIAHVSFSPFIREVHSKEEGAS